MKRFEPCSLPLLAELSLAVVLLTGTVEPLGAVKFDTSETGEPPEFIGLDAMPAFTEGASAIVLDGNVTVRDAELDNLNGGDGDYSGASLTVLRDGGKNLNDSFDFDTSGASFTVSGQNLHSGGLTFASFTSGSGELTVNFTSDSVVATTALVNDTVQHLTYVNTSDDPLSNVNLAWTFKDESDNEDLEVITVSVSNVNDEPTLTATGRDPVLIEGAGAPGVDLFSSVSADTVEQVNSVDRFQGLSMAVTNVSDGGG